MKTSNPHAMNKQGIVLATLALQRALSGCMQIGIKQSDCLIAAFTTCSGMASGIVAGVTAKVIVEGLTAETYFDHETQVALAMIYRKLTEAGDKLIPPDVRAEEAAMPDPNK